MSEVYAACVDQLLINLARHFKFIKDGAPIPGSWDYTVRKLAEMDAVTRESEQIILSMLGDADESLRGLLEEAIINGLKDSEPALKKAAENGLTNGVDVPNIAPRQMQAFQYYYEQSADKLNLVNTVMLESTEQAYAATVADISAKISNTQGILNTATGQIITGTASFNKVQRDAVRRMVDNGITGYIDHGNHHWSPEAYVAMDMRTTMTNTAREAVWEQSDSVGCELYQVSWHDGARPLCYPWQGKVISRNGCTGTVEDDEGNKVQVHSESEIESFRYGGGLFGVNCGHYPIPFFPGFSRTRPPQQNEEENAKEYAESQQQRALERKVREEKRELEVMKAQGASQAEIDAQKIRVRNASAKLTNFCDQTGRARQPGRTSTPINATFPDGYKQTKWEQGIRRSDATNGEIPGTPVLEQKVNQAAKTQRKTTYDFGGKDATITQEGQTIIRETITKLQKDFPLPEGYTLEVSDFRTRRNIGYAEDLDDLLDRLETETNDHYYGVKAQFVPLGSDGKQLCIEYIDTTLPNYSPKSQVFDELHKASMRSSGYAFNAGWGYECDTIHEYGHLISHAYGFYGSEDPEFVKWFDSLDKARIKKEISIYAATNWNEFFAEAFLQSYSPYQSDLSREAMEYLRKKMNGL